MHKVIRIFRFQALLLVLLLLTLSCAKQEEDLLKVAVVTGAHSFDVINFTKFFRSLEDVDPYIQHMEHFASSTNEIRQKYDVILFYFFFMDDPNNQDLTGTATHYLKTIEDLGEAGQGIMVLHHALLAYPQWSLWSELVGIQNREFGYHENQNLQVKVKNPDHPITRGVKSWNMIDETYTMDDAGEGSEILLTADHPKSMKTIGWTRTYKDSRVFCLESGHDSITWADPNFKQIVQQGIHWCAGLN